MIFKVIGPEVPLTTANVVLVVTNNNQQQVVVRVINTGAAAVLHIANNGTEYANLTVSNAEAVILQKGWNDTLTGAGMFAVPIAYKY